MTNRLLREPEVLEQVRFSHTTLWRLVRQGEFPKPRKLSPRVTVWLEQEVQAWLEQKLAA